MVFEGTLEKIVSRWLDTGPDEEDRSMAEIERLRESMDEEKTRQGFDPDLVTEYQRPQRQNIFLDESVLIDLKKNADRVTTAYFSVDAEDANVSSGDGRNYRRVDIEESVDTTIDLLETAVRQGREIYYPGTYVNARNNEKEEAITEFLDQHARRVSVDEIPVSEYPEDAGIAAEALDRDAVIVTYDVDFTDEEDLVMKHISEVYTPGQIYHSIL